MFDASYGDGFTGIYGTRRNFVQALRKQLVYWAKKPLYLLPQTYGKYKFPFVNWSIGIIRKANLAYARDQQTANAVGDCVKVTSDMAFGLTFDKSLYSMEKGRKRFGINVSSLLWDKLTVGRFNLKLDYRKFYYDLLNYLIHKGDFEIHLIPHVIDKDNYQSGENDCRILDELKNKYGNQVMQAPAFRNCIEAKSYIANMNIFLGSRMHATIAAISSGVATIPFSYAHKFEALYGSLNYPYVISATHITSDRALELVKEWINAEEVLKINGRVSVALAKNRLKSFENDLFRNLSKAKLI